MNLMLRSMKYMSLRGLILGVGFGVLMGVMSAMILILDMVGAIILGTLLGGGFGAIAGVTMGAILGALYSVITPSLYEMLSDVLFRAILVLIGALGTIFIAVVPPLSSLLPFWGYVVMGSLAAGIASYQYANWYDDEQRYRAYKRKSAAQAEAQTDAEQAL